jgi:hypothetical protein
MTEPELHPQVLSIAMMARRPVVLDEGARDRLLEAVRAEDAPRARRGPAHWWSAARVTMSAAGLTALAAGLVGIGVFLGRLAGPEQIRDDRSIGQPMAAAALDARLPVSDTVQTFVFVSPNAARVALVGDFNGWDPAATPLHRTGDGGVWRVSIPLTAGRYAYAFVVDDHWTPDPNPTAPLAPDDGFGAQSSIRLVAAGPSSL